MITTLAIALFTLSLGAATLVLLSRLQRVGRSLEDAQREGLATRRSLAALQRHLSWIEDELARGRSGEPERRSRRAPRTVLLVEDETDHRQQGVETLQAIGYTVFTAQDGFEAVEVYRAYRERVSLVILDAGLARQEFREVLARLREIAPDLRVLISSSRAPDGRVNEVLPVVQGFVRKPFRVAEMEPALRAALDFLQPAARATRPPDLARAR